MLEFYPNNNLHHTYFHQHPLIKNEGGGNSILQDKLSSPSLDCVEKGERSR